MEYGVLYQKIKYDEKTYLFKPIKVVEGITDTQNFSFLNENNEEIPILGDPRKLSEEYFIGNIIDEKEVFDEYLDEDTEEIKERILKECQEFIKIGTLSNQEFIVREMSILIEPKLEDDSNLIDPSYLELKKENLGDSNEDITFLTLEEINYLLSIENPNEIRKNLFHIMNHKEEYKTKIKGKDYTFLFDEELKNTNITEVKDILKDCRILITNKIDASILSEEPSATFLDVYQSTYEKIKKATSLEQIKKEIQNSLYYYEEILEDIKNLELEFHEYNSCIRVISLIIGIMQKFLSYEDLKFLLKDYKEHYQSSLKTIEALSKTLSLDKEEIILKNDISTQEDLSFDYLETYQYLVSHIINRNNQIDAILSNIDMVDNNPNPNKKRVCLIAGTTGTGKTHTFKELKKVFPNRPIVLTDTNQLTAAGYVGGTIEDTILKKLIEQAHMIHKKENPNFPNSITEQDIFLAQHGIVFLDEIDKRRSHQTTDLDVNGESVINSFLTLIDGTDYQISIGNGFQEVKIPFNSSNLVIFAGGAFQEYFDLQEKKIGYQINNNEFKKYLEVKPEDLVKYGLSSQFIGRCNHIILYPPHTKETLLRLESNSFTSSLENMKKLFKQQNITLVWEEDFILTVVEQAMKLKTGGRGINTILSRCLDNPYSEIKKYSDLYKAIYVNGNMVENPEEVLFITKEDKVVTMKEIIKRNEQEALKQYQINQITKEKDIYLETVSIIQKTKKMTNQKN